MDWYPLRVFSPFASFFGSNFISLLYPVWVCFLPFCVFVCMHACIWYLVLWKVVLFIFKKILFLPLLHSFEEKIEYVFIHHVPFYNLFHPHPIQLGRWWWCVRCVLYQYALHCYIVTCFYFCFPRSSFMPLASAWVFFLVHSQLANRFVGKNSNLHYMLNLESCLVCEGVRSFKIL